MSYCSINFCDKSASRFRDGAEYCQLHFDQLNEIAAAEHGFYIAERNLARYYFTADYEFYKQEFSKLEKHYRHLKRQLTEKQEASNASCIKSLSVIRSSPLAWLLWLELCPPNPVVV